jgi:choline-sulfatase
MESCAVLLSAKIRTGRPRVIYELAVSHRSKFIMSRVACAVLVLAASCLTRAEPSRDRSDAQKPNLLIITLDTTRADHLGCYGMKKGRTPVLDELASRGVLFEEAHSHVPLTLPSHATLFTGQLPSTLNVRLNGLPLKEGVETLATHLKSRGYWTGAVVATVILHREYGLARGFASYNDTVTIAPSSGGSPEKRNAQDVTDAALTLAHGIDRPFFLWVHYYDPHYPHRPPEPFATEFRSNLYDGEIAYMDRSIGKLLGGLGESGLLKNTLIVVVGDHGEGLMEHRERQHGIFLYEYALHVPLLMVWNGHIGPGLKIRNLCGLDDIAPTVLDLMGQDSLPETDGISLKPLLEGGTLTARTLYAESYHGFFAYGWAPVRAIITEQWKFIEAPKPELYEWRVSEEKNVYGNGRPEVRAAREYLQRYPPAQASEKNQMESILTDPNNEETLRRLRGLGYMSGGLRRNPPELLDPKDAIGIEEQLRMASDSLDAGDNRSAIETVTSVLKRNSQNVTALSLAGLAYLNTGEYQKAQACFQEAIRLQPQMETLRSNLGTVYKRMGKTELAIQEYKAALSISPRHSVAAANLAQIYLDQNSDGQARRVLDSALSAGGESADLFFEIGVLEAKTSNWEKARSAFTRVAALDPRRHEAYVNLGKIAYMQGRIDEAIYQYQRALRLAPTNTSYLSTLGSLYLHGKDDYAEALRYFRQALASDPNGPDAQNLRELIRGLQAEGVK